MGYTTTFKGSIKIEPPLSWQEANKINSFCNGRQDERSSTKHPGIWCDYTCTTTEIKWNGSEKSYDMVQWMEFLIMEFFRPFGRKLDGQMEAQGEDFNDRWLLVVTDNIVSVKRGKTVYE